MSRLRELLDATTDQVMTVFLAHLDASTLECVSHLEPSLSAIMAVDTYRGESLVAWLRQNLEKGDHDDQYRALSVIRAVSDQLPSDIVPILINVSRDSDGIAERCQAIEILGAVMKKKPNVEIQRALFEAMQQPARTVSLHAATALGAAGIHIEGPLISTLMDQAKSAPNGYTRYTAVMVLAGIVIASGQSANLLPILYDYIQREPSWSFRLAACEALAEKGASSDCQHVRDALFAALQEDTSTIELPSRSIARILRRMNERFPALDSSVALLAMLEDHATIGQMMRAVGVLVLLDSPLPPGVVQLLLEIARTSQDIALRRTAFRLLGPISTKAQTTEILDALCDHLLKDRPEDLWVRDAIIEALGQDGRLALKPEAIRRIIELTAPEEDLSVRASAIETLGKASLYRIPAEQVLPALQKLSLQEAGGAIEQWQKYAGTRIFLGHDQPLILSVRRLSAGNGPTKFSRSHNLRMPRGAKRSGRALGKRAGSTRLRRKR